MTASSQKYQQAAIAYFIYGVIYLMGAIYAGKVGIAPRAMGPQATFYFLIGAAFVVGFPILIWKGYKWFIRILALFMLYRIFEMVRLMLRNSGKTVPMPWDGEIPMVYALAVFTAIAAFTCFMLIRAGWNLRWP